MVNSASIARTEFSNRKGEDLHLPQCTCSIPLGEYSNWAPESFLIAPGFEAAQIFLRSKVIPDVWKMDMSQILDSSSSEEEEDNEEKESEEEEEEDEHEEEDKKKKKKKKQHIKEEVGEGHIELCTVRCLGFTLNLPVCLPA